MPWNVLPEEKYPVIQQKTGHEDTGQGPTTVGCRPRMVEPENAERKGNGVQMRRHRGGRETPTLLDRARPHVQRVPAGVPRLIVAALVFGVALMIEPRKTVYGNDGRYRPRPPGEVFDVQREAMPGTVVAKKDGQDGTGCQRRDSATGRAKTGGLQKMARSTGLAEDTARAAVNPKSGGRHGAGD